MQLLQALAPHLCADDEHKCFELFVGQAGCWDGTCMLWRVGLGATASAPEAGTHRPAAMQLLQHFAALEGPVRTLAWAPPSPGNPNSKAPVCRGRAL